MLNFYIRNNDSIVLVPNEIGNDVLQNLVWVDLFEPSIAEEKRVEALLGTSIPTRDEMHEIEVSSRLYIDNNTLYATASLMTKSDTPEPEIHAITFMLLSHCLVTIRYSDPSSFKVFATRLLKEHHSGLSSASLLVHLQDAIIDRIADNLEHVGHTIDAMSRAVFRPALKEKMARTKARPDFEETVRQIGVQGDSISKTRESLMSISRLLNFISHTPYYKADTEETILIQTLQHDIIALSDHASFLSNKVNFILDATLGMINVEQNAVIKILSIAAVVFLPPTLVASVYGMNFSLMPELEWQYGYPFGLFMMVLSALLPYYYFKRKGWL